MGMAVGMPEVKDLPAAVDLAKNPLAETHEFRQACSSCFVKTGKELFDGVHLCAVRVFSLAQMLSQTQSEPIKCGNSFPVFQAPYLRKALRKCVLTLCLKILHKCHLALYDQIIRTVEQVKINVI